MAIFELDAMQFILEILEWHKRQFVAKDGNFFANIDII